MNYSPKKMQEILTSHQFNFKKKFGQNFIIDENIIKNIVEKAEIDQDTLVIEVGPGAGSLTYFLAQKAKHVLCYEIDRSLQDILSANLQEFNNVDVIYGDFLKMDIHQDLKQYDYQKIYVVANLPYYITTPIIIKMIEDRINVDKIVVMVQKEVGNRFKAVPGTKEYNSLTIFLNYYFSIKKIMDVSKNVFLPKPNIDSIVIEFNRKKELFLLKNEEVFFQLIRDSFVQKRKTLKNNLKNYDLIKINKILQKYNMDIHVRAEQIPIEVFVELANVIGG